MKVNDIKKLVLPLAVLMLGFGGKKAFADYVTTLKVADNEINAGYFVKKVELKQYAMPEIRLEQLHFVKSELPNDAFPTNPNNFDVVIGLERKQPFALVRVPAYSTNEDGSVQRIQSLSIFVHENEPEGTVLKNRTAAKNTGVNAPLASGTWYKIGVGSTGLYKVDYNFMSTQLGINGVQSSQIRVFGHGAKMLSERNGTTDIKGLQENAIWVNDGGDGTFGPGDYFVFYAQGPLNWMPNSAGTWLKQEKNYYTDEGYYFINVDGGESGKRINTQTNPPTGNVTVNSYTGTVLHEEDLSSPQKFGKGWWGEEFSSSPGKQTNHTVTLNVGNTIGATTFNVHLVNTSQSPGIFNVKLNGQQVIYADISATNNYEYAPKAMGKLDTVTASINGAATFDISYNTASSDGTGWLDYISANPRKPLNMDQNSILFVDLNSIASGNIATYNLTGANGNTQVWDVTDPHNPVRMSGNGSSGTYTFSQDASTLHRFVAVNNADALGLPTYAGVVPNQNLYGSPQVDYVIVTYPDFLPAAEMLASFHRNRSGMRVLVATTTQVYNEFSSGAQDIGAIRDMMRMFYQRAGMNVQDMPKYLLLLGDASYDYKDRVDNNTNYVPTYEAYESFYFLNTFSTDDYFGFLDDNEEIERYDIANTLDIGVGRMPVINLQQANEMVDKAIYYKSPATLGDWRLNTMYVADNEDAAGEHLGDAELMNTIVQDNSMIHNPTKIYQDAIPMISTPGGARAPEANKAINDGVFKGVFMINYSGHGNTSVLSHERILTKDDYNKWRNKDKMPFMITATCDFGQFDQPSFVSSGEQLALKANGGVIATLTTTHLVYAHANSVLNREFLTAQFAHVNGRWNTFGDAMRIGKNGTYSNAGATKDFLINFRKFTLLGDPALDPNFPQYFIKTSSIVDGATGQPTDTIGALGEYIVNGEVTDVNGNRLTNFNGELSVTIFDKPRTVKTITAVDKTFEVRNNTIYKGKASVNAGKFSFAFIAPKDINYEFGDGRTSFYAHNGETDAAGRDTGIIVGGFSDNPRLEDNPPIVRAFIKDSLFRQGGLTGSNTALFAILEDETGINVSGNSVGHDLTAILDDDVSKPYIMNDYYETAPNTYKRGYVYFPIENIPDGRHKLTVKAWDVNNNSGEGDVYFVVKDGAIVEMQELMNYPNPFRDVTHFVFEHNHPDEDMTAEINIYNTSGVLVRKLQQNFVTTASRSNEITWDATDDNGAKLPAGMYIYRMKISAGGNIETTGYQKLVLVR
ncbi:MAG: type IX secretion system sortase PorU [Chitinophagales bacterium]|nr:type IX secretion system sortase PorU [Chitinophagaceae bacterium]MCB9065806.1 type IX secretion system sortase PorU [Chitinophagales bacterium]